MSNISYLIIGIFIGHSLTLAGLALYKIYCKKAKPKLAACTNCGCTALSLLSSNNIKRCIACGHEMPWHLDPGQLPLVRSNRMVKRNDNQTSDN